MRKGIVYCFCLLMFFPLLGKGNNYTTKLRGYGKVEAFFGKDEVSFICENEEKADILLGKLLSDLFWDAGEKHILKELSLPSGTRIKIHSYYPFGVLAVGRNKKIVRAVGGDNEEELLKKLKKDRELRDFFSSKDTLFFPIKPYPVYLDFYDLRAFKSYTHAMSSPREKGLESHWEFVKKFCLGGLATQYPDYQFVNPAPGVFQLAPLEYELKEAERNEGLYVVCFNFGGNAPLWFYNQHPYSFMEVPPTLLLGGWGKEGAAGAHYESWGISSNEREEGGLRFERKVMTKCNDHPYLGGWHIYAGAPGGEMAFHSRTTAFYDFSSLGKASFRSYLREVKKYTLSQLGERWYGDPLHFKNWAEVEQPDPFNFYGDLENGFRIEKDWSWIKAYSDTPPPENAEWIHLEMPPSQQELLLPWGNSFYKARFNCKNWLEKNRGKEIYLVCSIYAYDEEGTNLWLNGNFMGRYKSPLGLGPFSLRVTQNLNEGENELILEVPGEGKIFGPIFLTSEEPRFYPYLGKEKNARYVDFKEWQLYAYCHYHIPGLELAREIDPNRPIILSPDQITAGYALDFAERYGLGLQFTGQGGWYYPWWTGYGYLRGIYGGSEPGGTIEKKWMDRLMGWILINGESNFNLFWTLEDYIKMEEETGWFSKNRGLIQLFGKAIREKPSIVLFRPTVEMILDPLETFWTWDIGRGELQGSHYDNLYATEEDVARGLVDSYPVLFDCGTTIMDEKTIKAIKKYVEQGGTFIAIHNTGMHSLLEADCWPISELTGFKVVSKEKRGKLKFENNIPIFKGWEEKEFEGEGIALDYRDIDYEKERGIGLKAMNSQAIPLARWEDGSIAIGYTRLGKGRIILLGSTFWRSGRDVSGVWVSQGELERAFFEKLFTDLGIERNADSFSPEIWVRKFVTKNGLEEWFIVFNSSSHSIYADIALKTTKRPREVWDKIEMKNVDFQYEDNWVKIKDLGLKPYETKVFGVKRTDMIDAISFWWWEKTKYWRACELQIGKSQSRIGEGALTEVLSFDKFRFFPDRDASLNGNDKWKKTSYNDSSWLVLPAIPWNLADDSLKDYKGIGLYRAKFTLPEEWRGKRILLELYSFDHPIVFDYGEFFLNSNRIASYKARGWSQTLVYDVTDYLQEGENVLAIKVEGGKEFSGICGAVFLFPAQLLEPFIDLSGEWRVVKGDFLTTETIQIPGNTRGKYLVKEVEIPAEWKGREIYLHIEIPQQWLRSIVINGRLINYNSFLHPYGTISEVNITPYIKPGTVNKIELWPATIATFNEEPMEVLAIKIGCEKR